MIRSFNFVQFSYSLRCYDCDLTQEAHFSITQIKKADFQLLWWKPWRHEATLKTWSKWASKTNKNPTHGKNVAFFKISEFENSLHFYQPLIFNAWFSLHSHQCPWCSCEAESFSHIGNFLCFHNMQTQKLSSNTV